MAQGPSGTILVAIRITLRIRKSKVRNPDPPDRRRFVLCECILVFVKMHLVVLSKWILSNNVYCTVWHIVKNMIRNMITLTE